MEEIKLTKGKFALVDDEDFEYLNQWKWCMFGEYAGRNQWIGRINGKSKNKHILMHKLINKTPKGMDTDHINRNKLDNRKNNLRNVTRSQNMRNIGLTKSNTSGVKGITWDKINKKWMVQLKVKNIRIKKRFVEKEKAELFRKSQELLYWSI